MPQILCGYSQFPLSRKQPSIASLDTIKYAKDKIPYPEGKNNQAHPKETLMPHMNEFPS